MSANNVTHDSTEPFASRAAPPYAQMVVSNSTITPTMPGSCEGGVIVQVSRLPKNIGEMMNKLLSGEIVAMHLIAVTKDDSVIHTSTEGIPDYIRVNDDF